MGDPTGLLAYALCVYSIFLSLCPISFVPEVVVTGTGGYKKGGSHGEGAGAIVLPLSERLGGQVCLPTTVFRHLVWWPVVGFNISQRVHVGPQWEWNGYQRWLLDWGMTQLSFWRWHELHIMTCSSRLFLFISNAPVQSVLFVFNTLTFHLLDLCWTRFSGF